LKLIIIQDQHSLTVVPIAEECVSRYLSTLLDVNTLIRLLFVAVFLLLIHHIVSLKTKWKNGIRVQNAQLSA